MMGDIFGLEGRTAVVTGAGANGGIGHAVALGLARRGVRLVLGDCDVAGLQQTLSEIEGEGGSAVGETCDIGDPAAVAHLFARADQWAGRVDILVNVPFAFPARCKPHELDLADWEETQRVSVTGYFLCCREAIARMRRQGGGVIVNVGSNAGVAALGRGAFAYSCAKAAVNQLTRELAVEYAGDNIRVNAILPAQTLTPGLRGHLDRPEFRDRVLPRILAGIPQGRLLDPEDMVGPVLFLASDGASAITGALLPVDGGNLALNAGGG